LARVTAVACSVGRHLEPARVQWRASSPGKRLPLGVDLTIVRFFELDRRYMAQGAVQPALVEPEDPVEQVVEPAMRIITSPTVQLGLDLQYPSLRLKQGDLGFVDIHR
jgi:hypothetical protein